MNTQFNISRFFKLFVNDYRANYKKNLLFAGSLLVLMVLYFVFFATMQDRMDMEGTFILLMVALWVGQGAYTCMTFGEFSSKKRTQQLLVTPATHTEIFWSKFLSSFIIYPAVFCLYGLLVLQLNVIYNNWYILHTGYKYIGYASLSEFWTSTNFIGETVVRLSFAFVSLFISTGFLWGALTFKKYAFLKTLVSWFLFLFLLWPLSILVYFIISGNYTPQCVPFIGMGEDFCFVPLFDYYPNLIWYIASFVSLSLIAISRIKFNEKTI